MKNVMLRATRTFIEDLCAPEYAHICSQPPRRGNLSSRWFYRCPGTFYPGVFLRIPPIGL